MPEEKRVFLAGKVTELLGRSRQRGLLVVTCYSLQGYRAELSIALSLRARFEKKRKAQWFVCTVVAIHTLLSDGEYE